MLSTGSTKVVAALGTFALLLFLFAQPMAATPSQPRIAILILDGFSNHDWHQTTALLRGILEASGLFTVSVSTAPSTTASPGWEQWRPNFSDYDVVRIPPGQGENTGHDGRSDVVVHRLGDDPIHHGMPRVWKTPTLEIYYYARGPAKHMRVLSSGYDQHTRLNWPLELAVRFGPGRGI